MSNFRPIDRQTPYLLPPSVDDWLPERHLARFVVEVTEGLDLSAMSGAYRGSGSASYHPRLLLALLVYGYATGVFSSRKLERATYDFVAFRFVAANEHPDHDTIAAFRKRFLKEIEALFVQVLLLARETGLLKLGTVALDGTKVHANASKHSALSYEHAGKIEAQLKAEAAELMAKAEAADQADIPDGMSIPDELARREERLQKIAEARAKIEARAKERHEQELAGHRAKLAARETKEKATGKKPGGRPPAPPVEGPLPTDQVNLTDEESRIMPVPGGGFEQCYNAQAVVAEGSLLVVASDKAEAAELMAKAEAADQADIPDGMSIPDELARREERLQKIAEARAKIEARAKERHEQELAGHRAKLAARETKEKATGKKPGGRPPAPPVEGPLPTDQVNLTDEESRIMPVPGGGFEQCYNAQAVVAEGSLLVVASDVVQAPNDKQQLKPMLAKTSALPEELGKAETMLADSGYFSEANVKACLAAGIEPLIALGRDGHHPSLSERFADAPPAPQNPTPAEAMAYRLQTPEGKKLYAKRKCMPEPVFGIIKSVLGFRQFLLRGLNNVRGEWSLVTMAWNVKRMFALKAA